MGFIDDLGHAAIPSVVGAGMGLLLEGHNDERQRKQQQALTNIQTNAQKDLTAYSYGKQMDMWNATNYEAQVAHLKAAGLNPGLLYGKGGGGAATTGTAGATSVAGAQAPAGGQEAIGMGMQLQQAALMNAQKEVLESQAKLNNVTADKAAGVDTELTKTQTASLTQGIENQKAQERLTNIQSNIQEIEQDIKSQTKTATVSNIVSNADIAFNQLNILKNDSLISDNTWSQKIDIVAAEYAKLILNNELTKSQQKLTEQQIGQVIQTVKTQVTQLGYENRRLDQKDQDILIDKTRNELIEKGIWVGAISNSLGDIINMFTKKRK